MSLDAFAQLPVADRERIRHAFIQDHANRGRRRLAIGFCVVVAAVVFFGARFVLGEDGTAYGLFFGGLLAAVAVAMALQHRGGMAMAFAGTALSADERKAVLDELRRNPQFAAERAAAQRQVAEFAAESTKQVARVAARTARKA